jgi:AcrR family transcriptional regulator
MTRAKKDSMSKNKVQEFPEDLVVASSHNPSLVEKKHKQIVDGACKVFFKKGFHPTTTRDIAKACGMSMGQLYHYISSKDDVLYLVHKHSQKIWYEYLEQSRLEQIDDPLHKLTEALRHSLVFLIENKKLFQFIYSESKYLDKKHLRIVLDMDYQNVVGFWRKLLKEVDTIQPLQDNTDFLGSVIAYLLVFLALRGWTLDEKPNIKHVDSLVEFILRGVGAK